MRAVCSAGVSSPKQEGGIDRSAGIHVAARFIPQAPLPLPGLRGVGGLPTDPALKAKGSHRLTAPRLPDANQAPRKGTALADGREGWSGGGGGQESGGLGCEGSEAGRVSPGPVCK